MTTCVIHPLRMGAIPRETCLVHGTKLLNDHDLMDAMKKQVQDSSYWSPTPMQALPTATTERSSRSALRALLQQPPPLSFVPADSRLESHSFPNDSIQPSWSPYPDQADFKTPNSLSGSKLFPQQHDTPQSSDHQARHQGFDLQPPTSSAYHANYSYRSGVRQTDPVVGSVPFKQDQSDESLLHRRQALQTERTTRSDFPAGSPGASSSLPKEFEKMQMMAFAQKQMREQMKNRLERRRSFDKKSQGSPPKREGAGGSKLKFGITADGIPNGPDKHPMHPHPHPHPQQQKLPQKQQQQLLFSRGFFPTANKLRDQDMHTDNRGSPGSAFSMETKTDVEDTEALVIKQFQEKVLQLDMGTRLGFQESLYRLARSARERQDSTRTSAEPDYAAMINMDLDSCDRPTSEPQFRVQIETQTNLVDRTLVNMLYSPLPLPGLQGPDHHPSWSRSRAMAVASSQGNSGWSTPSSAASEHKIRKGSAHMVQAQFHGRDGSGAAALPEKTISRTFTPHMTWSGAPRLADYASPPPGSSPVDPSMLNNRPASVINLTYGGAVAHTTRQLGGIHSSTTKPVDIRGPRRCDSQSSIASDLSNASSHGGQILNVNNVGFQGPSSQSSPDASSFVSDGHHIELAAGNHGMDGQQLSNQSFAMMNMNDDNAGAALSIQNRGEVNEINRFHRPQSSAPSYNSTAKNVTVGFSPMLYDDGSRFEGESRGRSLGNISASTGMSIFDERGATVSRNMVDTVAYTRSGSEFFQA